MPPQWETLLCNQMGWPAATGEGNAIIFEALDLWAQSEGIDPSANNWLATEYNLYGNQPKLPGTNVSIFNSVGDGVTAIVNTLNGGGYGEVNKYFAQGTSLIDIYLAINLSPWCSGCQNGNYPDALQAVVANVSTYVPPPPAAPSVIGVNFDFGVSSQDQLMMSWWAQLAQWVEQGAALVEQDLLTVDDILMSI